VSISLGKGIYIYIYIYIFVSMGLHPLSEGILSLNSWV